jgi:hypothetical protein
MPLALTAPRVLSDAVVVCANPADYANRPTLLHLARLVMMSATGMTPQQLHPRTMPAKPVLRALQGGLQ